MRIINCNRCRHIYIYIYIFITRNTGFKRNANPYVRTQNQLKIPMPPDNISVHQKIKEHLCFYKHAICAKRSTKYQPIIRWGSTSHLAKAKNINLSIENRSLTNGRPIFCQLQKPGFTIKSWVVVVCVFSFCTPLDPIVFLIASQC